MVGRSSGILPGWRRMTPFRPRMAPKAPQETNESNGMRDARKHVQNFEAFSFCEVWIPGQISTINRAQFALPLELKVDLSPTKASITLIINIVSFTWLYFDLFSPLGRPMTCSIVQTIIEH